MGWHRTIREQGILRVMSTSAAEIVATLLCSQAQASKWHFEAPGFGYNQGLCIRESPLAPRNRPCSQVFP